MLAGAVGSQIDRRGARCRILRSNDHTTTGEGGHLRDDRGRPDRKVRKPKAAAAPSTRAKRTPVM